MESNSISLKDVWAKTDPFQSIMTHATLSGLAAQVIWESTGRTGVLAVHHTGTGESMAWLSGLAP